MKHYFREHKKLCAGILLLVVAVICGVIAVVVKGQHERHLEQVRLENIESKNAEIEAEYQKFESADRTEKPELFQNLKTESEEYAQEDGSYEECQNTYQEKILLMQGFFTQDYESQIADATSGIENIEEDSDKEELNKALEQLKNLQDTLTEEYTKYGTVEEEKYQEYTASLADYEEKCADRLDAIAKEEKEAEEAAQRAAEESAAAEEAARAAAEQEEAKRQQEAAAATTNAPAQPQPAQPAQTTPETQAPAAQPSQPAETQPAQQAPAGNPEHNWANVRNYHSNYVYDENGNKIFTGYIDDDTQDIYDENFNYIGNAAESKYW